MKLSRYMDIKKYKDLLSTKTLYFPRYDQFEDKLEGSMQDCVPPKKLIYQRTREIERMSANSQDGKMVVLKVLESVEPILYESFLKNFTFLSCWHRGSNESSLMWKTYAQKGIQKGIMVISDLSSLKSSLRINAHSFQHVGAFCQSHDSDSLDGYEICMKFDKVIYQTLGNEINYIGLDRYLRKQKPYEDEKEYRAVFQVQLGPGQRPGLPHLLGGINILVWNNKVMSDLIIEIWDKLKQSYETHTSILKGHLPNSHVRCPVDINSLVKEVVINPYGNVDSDTQEIQALNREFGLSAPVKQSKIKTGAIPTTFKVKLPDGREIQT